MFPDLLDKLWLIVVETWKIFQEAGVFILFGFFMAGLIHAFVSPGMIIRFLGKGRYRSVFWAAVLGIPMPLCSCSVIPAALSLKKHGAGNGATVSFLISTPECDVDTVAYTYGLMGPVMAFFRPFAAWFTAMVAGTLVEYLRLPDVDDKATPPPVDACCSEKAPAPDQPDACCAPGDHAHTHTPVDADPLEVELKKEPWHKRVFDYGFGSFMDETAHWLVLGLVLSGITSALLPPTLVEEYLGQGILPLLVMLFIGTIFYTCATSSTPIAAVLMLKGLSPGAALVFLLAGPATSIGTIILLIKFLGRRVVSIYLGAILVCTLGMGLALDAFYAASGLNPVAQIHETWQLIPDWIEILGALVILALLARSILRAPMPVEWRKFGAWLGRMVGLRLSLRAVGVVIILLLGLLFLSSMFVVVEPGSAAVVRRFGAITGTALEPGLHFRLPPPIDLVAIVETDAVRQIEVGYRSYDPPRPPHNLDSSPEKAQEERFRAESQESLMMTGDEAFVEIRYNVHYNVVDPVAYATRADNVDDIIRNAALAAGMATTATRDIADAFGDTRADAEATIRERTIQTLAPFDLGIRILRVNLIYVHAPAEVHDVYRDYASAQHDEKTSIINAMAEAAEIVQIAEASATAAISAAQGDYAREVEIARGRADAFNAEGAAFDANPSFTELRTRLDAQSKALEGKDKILVSPEINPRRLEIVVLPEDKDGGAGGGNNRDLINRDGSGMSPESREQFERIRALSETGQGGLH